MSSVLVSEDYSLLLFIFRPHTSLADEHANYYVWSTSQTKRENRVFPLENATDSAIPSMEGINYLHTRRENLRLNIWHKRF